MRAGGRGKKTKVVIVGGGYSALTAAFELTNPRNRRDAEYEVTIYTAGWRLGGKAASSRSSLGGDGTDNAIVERAPHLWMGWYENAFQIIRQLYEDWTGDADAWRDAFDTATVTATRISTSGSNGRLWKFDLPPAPGLPGDAAGTVANGTVGQVVSRLWDFTATILESLDVAGGRGRPIGGRSLNDRIGALLGRSGLMEPLAVGALIQTMEWPIVAARLVGDSLRLRNGRSVTDRSGSYLTQSLRRKLDGYLSDSEDRKRMWELVDLVVASTRGLVHAVVRQSTIKDLDKLNFSAWLRMHGASPESLNSPVMRGMHSMGMGCRQGDPDQLCVAAGAGLWAFIRTLFYRGDYLWQLARGPGEDVFVPFYEVLKSRGVRFQFFHRLRKVHVDRRGGVPRVAALDFDLQAQVKSIYDPLLGTGRSAYWPDAPLGDQLDGWESGGIGLRRADLEAHEDDTKAREQPVRLGVDDDFDYVILGTGVAATKACCDQWLRDECAPEPWRQMFVPEAWSAAGADDPTSTVATQAFQLWLKAPVKDLGLQGPPLSMAGLDGSFDCCVDMRHRIYSEVWRESPEASAPKGILHFRGFVKDDQANGDGRLWDRENTQECAKKFLNTMIKDLLPDAVNRNGRFREDLIAGAYYSANTDPNFRSPQMLPRTTQVRLRPYDKSVSNLRVCGDWTDCGVNTSSAESAIMSARLAAVSIMCDGDDRELLKVPGFAETQSTLFGGIWDVCYSPKI